MIEAQIRKHQLASSFRHIAGLRYALLVTMIFYQISESDSSYFCHNHNVDGLMTKPRKHKGIFKHTDETRRKIAEVVTRAKTGKKLSEYHRKRIGESQRDDKNHMWKGDNASLVALHTWVRYRLVKPDLCQQCKKSAPYDLANISGCYKRDLIDWQWLCRKCHMMSDGRLGALIGYSIRRRKWND